MIGLFFDMFTAAMFILSIYLFTYLFIFFGWGESLNVCKPKTTLYPL